MGEKKWAEAEGGVGFEAEAEAATGRGLVSESPGKVSTVPLPVALFFFNS